MKFCGCEVFALFIAMGKSFLHLTHCNYLGAVSSQLLRETFSLIFCLMIHYVYWLVAKCVCLPISAEAGIVVFNA